MHLKKILLISFIIATALSFLIFFSPKPGGADIVESLILMLICAVPLGIGISISFIFQIKRGKEQWETSISKANIPEWLKKYYKWLYGIENVD